MNPDGIRGKKKIDLAKVIRYMERTIDDFDHKRIDRSGFLTQLYHLATDASREPYYKQIETSLGNAGDLGNEGAAREMELCVGVLKELK